MLKNVPSGLKILLLSVCLFFGSFSCFSQTTIQKSQFWNKVRFGGGIGLGFTNGGFNASLSPNAIYQFNDQFALGASLNFNYYKFNQSKFLAYGGGILSLYNPIPFLQLSAEFEQLRINKTLIGPQIENNYWSPALFLGAGYSTRNFTFGMRYDVLYDNQNSIYANAWLPFVRVYF